MRLRVCRLDLVDSFLRSRMGSDDRDDDIGEMMLYWDSVGVSGVCWEVKGKGEWEKQDGIGWNLIPLSGMLV